MIVNFIISYLAVGLFVNYGVSVFDKIEISESIKESDKSLNPHLVILLWFVLLAGVIYSFIKILKKQ